MNERQLCSNFLRKYQLEHRAAVVIRIPDSPVGRKPFDAFILDQGVFVAIEFKILDKPLLPHQERELRKVKAAGGIAKVIYFGPQGQVKEVVL